MGGGGGKGDLEKSRFDWVFLNDGVPKSESGRGVNPTTNLTVSKYKPNAQRKPIVLSTVPIIGY